jgi:hypothetical protein
MPEVSKKGIGVIAKGLANNKNRAAKRSANLKKMLRKNPRKKRFKELTKNQLKASLYSTNPTNQEKDSGLHRQQKIYELIQLDPGRYVTFELSEISIRIEQALQDRDNLSGLAQKAAEFNIHFFNALKETRRPQNIKLIDDMGYFSWPQIFLNNCSQTNLGNFGDFVEEGVLCTHGYNARINGPSEMQRRKILDKVFNEQLRLPKDCADDYTKNWGAPNTSTRLHKMAQSLAAFRRQQKYRQSPSKQAIDKWGSDLDYLRHTYYAQFKKTFSWPAH